MLPPTRVAKHEELERKVAEDRFETRMAPRTVQKTELSDWFWPWMKPPGKARIEQPHGMPHVSILSSASACSSQERMPISRSIVVAVVR